MVLKLQQTFGYGLGRYYTFNKWLISHQSPVSPAVATQGLNKLLEFLKRLEGPSSTREIATYFSGTGEF
jgi:hypothetical protein